MLREIADGLVNGITFATIVGTIAALWFRDPDLGMVIAAAMVINLFAAAVAGIAIPLTLDKFDVDPAVRRGCS